MRVRNKTLMGRIGENGELNLHWDALKEFLSSHKGKVAIVRVELMAVEPTERTRNYFFGYIIPELRNAFMEQGEHLTKEETYDKIRMLCPLFAEEKRENGQWRKTYKEFEQLDQAEANEVIDWLFQWSAENLYKVLDNPL